MYIIIIDSGRRGEGDPSILLQLIAKVDIYILCFMFYVLCFMFYFVLFFFGGWRLRDPEGRGGM